MSAESGGTDKASGSNTKFSGKYTEKPRSFSLSEIQEIILGSDSKNSNEQKNTESDKNKHVDTDGTKNKNKITPSVDDIESLNNVDLIFKPQNGLQRSPPPPPSGTPNDSKKRPREENSLSGNEQETKRPCDSDTPEINNRLLEEVIDEIMENEKRVNLENSLLEIFESLETIQGLSNQDNQNIIQNATFKIQKNLTLITYKIGQLEQEKMDLKHRIQLRELKLPIENTNDDKVIESLSQQRTYANIVENATSESKGPKDKKWTTPKTSKKLETIITMDNITDPKETIRQIKTGIGSSALDGGLKNIKQLKSGAVVLESYNESQRQKIKEALGNKQNITVKETSVVNPMFLITGILKGYSNSEFIDELIRMNSEIQDDLPDTDFHKVIKVIAKKNCRNAIKENWILEAPPRVAKWFLKKQTVFFDLMKVYIQEHFNLAVCFNCSGFGHVAKYCKDSACCHKCAATDHSAKDCTATELKCPNCRKMKYKEELCKHSARDTNCPVYQKRVTAYKNQINYTDNFLS